MTDEEIILVVIGGGQNLHQLLLWSGSAINLSEKEKTGRRSFTI